MAETPTLEELAVKVEELRAEITALRTWATPVIEGHLPYLPAGVVIDEPPFLSPMPPFDAAGQKSP